jgi:hypothetical protein
MSYSRRFCAGPFVKLSILENDRRSANRASSFTQVIRCRNEVPIISLEKAVLIVAHNFVSLHNLSGIHNNYQAATPVACLRSIFRQRWACF